MPSITDMILDYGIIIIFLNVLFEQAGLPLPTYPTLTIAGALSFTGGIGATEVVTTAIAAAMIADLLWYSAGARFGRRVLAILCKFSLAQNSCVHRTESIFGRFGSRALLFAKFVPSAGPIAACMSGIIRMRMSHFLSFDFVGVTIYVVFPVLMGRVFHDAIDFILEVFASLGTYGAAALAVALAVLLLVRWRRHRARLHLELGADDDVSRSTTVADVTAKSCASIRTER